MNRPTRSAKVALRRAGEVLDPLVEITDEGGGSYSIRLAYAGLAPTTKNTQRALAFVADLIWRSGEGREELRAYIRYAGIPRDGLPAWEERAMRWLTDAETPVAPRG